MMPLNPAIGGTILRRAAEQSPNYVAGSAGWYIGADGSAEFNDLTVRGTFDGNDWELNSQGFFMYSGSPASGDLVISIAQSAGTDSYGNAYPAGVKIAGTGTSAGAYAELDTTYGRLLVQNVLSGYQAICDGGSLTMSTPSSTANPATISVQDSPQALILQSPSDGTDPSAEMKLYAATASVGAYVQSPAIVGLNPSTGSAETWHTLGIANWTGTVRYRMGNGNRVWIETVGSLATNGVTANGTQIATMPAGWQPTVNTAQIPLIISAVGSGSAAYADTPLMEIDTSGNARIYNISVQVATNVRFAGSYAID